MKMIRIVAPVLVLFLLGGLIVLSGGIDAGQRTVLPAPPPEPTVQRKPLDAVIVSHDAPETVNHEDSYRISITVTNTGSEAWSEACQTRLCIWQDGQDWGYRARLPEKVIVHPGDVYTFTLNDFVLPEAEETLLEFQMVCEGIAYFGERAAARIKAAD